MKKWITAGLILATMMACTNNNEQTVSGTITNAEGLEVSLIGFDSRGQADTLASTTLSESGKFSLPIKTGNLALYVLDVGDKSNIVLAFDSTESPVVTADYETLHQSYEVSKSKDSENIRNTYVESFGFERQLDSLMRGMQNAAQTGDDASRVQMADEYNKVRVAYKNFLIEKINKDSTDLGNFAIAQRLDPNQDLEFLVKVKNGLQPRLAGNVFFDQFANNVAQYKREVRAGMEAPEIELPSPEGDMVALSSLRGNYVLIDFWAAWCKPCRVENPNLVRIYEKYRDDNFEIFGVSLDRTHENWVEAIAQDNLPWAQVSDLQYWQSAAAQLYNVTAIPHTVLLDPDGIVIATKLRGKPLEDKLASIFGH